MSSVRSNASVCVELTADNLQHIVNHLQLRALTSRKQMRRHGGTPVDFPSIGCPAVKWHAGRRAVYVVWQDADGRQKSRTITPQKSDIDDVWESRVTECAKTLQEFYEESDASAK